MQGALPVAGVVEDRKTLLNGWFESAQCGELSSARQTLEEAALVPSDEMPQSVDGHCKKAPDRKAADGGGHHGDGCGRAT